MTFEELLATVGQEPVFESAILLAGDVDPGDARRQLSRWVAAGRLHQLRRGLYALAPPSASNWRRLVRDRVESLHWSRVVSDVRPFLEDQRQDDLLTRESVLSLLR